MAQLFENWAAGTEGTLEGDVISCPAGDPAAVSPAFEMKAHGAR